MELAIIVLIVGSLALVGILLFLDRD